MFEEDSTVFAAASGERGRRQLSTGNAGGEELRYVADLARGCGTVLDRFASSLHGAHRGMFVALQGKMAI